MEKEFIPYEQALELRHLGYNYESSYYWRKGNVGFYVNYGEYNYTNDHWMFNADDGKNRQLLCTAPLYQQAFRWFREKYNYIPHIYKYQDLNKYDFDLYGGLLDLYDEYSLGDDIFDTYEEVELACLKKLIEIAKNK